MCFHGDGSGFNNQVLNQIRFIEGGETDEIPAWLQNNRSGRGGNACNCEIRVICNIHP